MSTPRPSRPASNGLDAWEAAFEPGLVANSRANAPEPWLAGHVHVARDLPEQKEPVQTGGLDGYFVLVMDSRHSAREHFAARRPHYDGLARPGDVWIYPEETKEEEHWTSWSAGAAFTSVMLPPKTVAKSAQALERDYARLEFIERYGERDAFLEAAVRLLGAELTRGAPGGRLYAEQLMQALAMHLVTKHTAEAPRLKPYRGRLPAERLERVQDYVRAHLDQELRLADLAAEAFLSEYHFARVFKASTGETPAAYVRRVRLEEGARLLREQPRWTVARVALAVGYRDPASFASVFRRHTGLSPSDYRRAVQ